jgi:hypothetical protein
MHLNPQPVAEVPVPNMRHKWPLQRLQRTHFCSESADHAYFMSPSPSPPPSFSTKWAVQLCHTAESLAWGCVTVDLCNTAQKRNRTVQPCNCGAHASGHPLRQAQREASAHRSPCVLAHISCLRASATIRTIAGSATAWLISAQLGPSEQAAESAYKGEILCLLFPCGSFSTRPPRAGTASAHST